jgi:hypothetical protein
MLARSHALTLSLASFSRSLAISLSLSRALSLSLCRSLSLALSLSLARAPSLSTQVPQKFEKVIVFMKTPAGRYK